MAKWILDGIRADAFRGIGKRLVAAPSPKQQYSLGSKITTKDGVVRIKSRLPNVLSVVRNTLGLYDINGGCVSGDGLEVHPYAVIATTTIRGPTLGYTSTPQLRAGKDKTFFCQRTQGTMAVADVYPYEGAEDTSSVQYRLTGIAQFSTATTQGKIRPEVSVDGFQLIPVTHPNGQDARMVFFDAGEIAPGYAYLGVCADVISGDYVRSTILLLPTEYQEGIEPAIAVVWPPAEFADYGVVGIDSIAPGIVAMIIGSRSPDELAQPAKLVVRDIFTATTVDEVDLNTLDPEFTNTSLWNVSPNIGCCVTSVSPTRFLFVAMPVSKAPKIYKYDAGGSISLSLSLPGHTIVGLFSIYGQHSLVSLKNNHAIYFSYLSSVLYVHVTEDGGNTWASSTVASNPEWDRNWYPYAATACHYTKNLSGQLVPDEWVYPIRSSGRQWYRVYSTPVPTAATFLREIEGFTPDGISNTAGGFPGVAVYTGEEFDSTIPLKPGHPGLLEY